ATGPLLELMKRGDSDEQYGAQALGRIADPAAMPALTFVVEFGKSGFGRAAAAEALARFSDATSEAALTRATHDGAELVATCAAYALAKRGIKRSEMIERIAGILRGSDNLEEERRTAAVALGLIGDPAGVSLLRLALQPAERWDRVDVSILFAL